MPRSTTCGSSPSPRAASQSFAALVEDGAAVSILASVAAAGAAAFGTYRMLHSTGYELASATGIVHWEAGLGLWAMGVGAGSAVAALLTAKD